MGRGDDDDDVGEGTLVREARKQDELPIRGTRGESMGFGGASSAGVHVGRRNRRKDGGQSQWSCVVGPVRCLLIKVRHTEYSGVSLTLLLLVLLVGG